MSILGTTFLALLFEKVILNRYEAVLRDTSFCVPSSQKLQQRLRVLRMVLFRYCPFSTNVYLLDVVEPTHTRLLAGVLGML